MKTQILSVVLVVLLLGVLCYFGSNVTELPGKDVANNDLATIWGANTTPGPLIGSACSVLPKTFPACTSAGNSCGSVSASSGTDLNAGCNGSPVGHKTTFSVVSCKKVSQTQCELLTSGPSMGGYRCGPSTKEVGVGTRDNCQMTTTSLPKEP
jgi:hypothetical protein